MLPVRAPEMCNDQGWRVIELEIHRVSISDIKERLIIDRKCVSYENQGFPEQRASYEISDSILGQLDDMVSRIDPAVEYQYWFEEQTTFDGEEEGISILIDGKRVATVSSWSEMPTQPLKHLFAVLYALSPYELGLHSNSYGGFYDVPD